MLSTLRKQLELAKEKNKVYLAIKLDTPAKWEKALKMLDELGYRWRSSPRLIDENIDIASRWQNYGEDSHLIIDLTNPSSNSVSYGPSYALNDAYKVVDYDDLLEEEQMGGRKMLNTNTTANLKEWAYDRDDIGMTNLAKYIYKAFAKKFAKAYKEQYQTEQSAVAIEDIVYKAFRYAHRNGNFLRTPAKLVVMNKAELDVGLWKRKLGLAICFISNGIYFAGDMATVKVDGVIRHISDGYVGKFNEMYIRCDSCGCYHDKSKTNLVKVYNHRTESVDTTCSKSTGNRKLIDGVYYNPALIKDDGTVAKRRVLSYHSFDWCQPKAQAKSLGNNDNSLKMGIEIETYGNPANSAFVNKYDDHFHCENDGSLSYGNSFEMISVPMTKNYWDSIRNSIISPLFDALKANGQTEGDSGYGLHIHIDSKAFKDLDSVKWFIYNVQLHQRLIQAVARRKSSHYYDYQTSGGVYAVEELNLSRLQQQFSSHGTCVNTHMCGNDVGKTIELRVFKSTLDSETLYSTLKLVENLVRLANEHSTDRRELLRGLKDYAIKQRIVIE